MWLFIPVVMVGTAPPARAAMPATPAPAVEAAASPLTATTSEATDAPALNGLLPLWEHTGVVEESGAAQVGWARADVGVGPLTIGTQPFLDLFGTWNLTGKLGLVRQGRLRLALDTGWYRVPTAAQSRGLGNLHAGAFSNPYAPVTLVPAALAATFLVKPRLHLHASATVIKTLSDTPELATLTAGLAGWVEWFASEHRSVRLHAGLDAYPTDPQAHLGISFGWRYRHVALQAGYARRFAADGTSDGAIMFDTALLFP
jgi:hypothetical protein